MATEDGVDASRSGAPTEERKTETTLTTRIRINIPGSRPIPPVVVRKPVADADAPAEGAGAETRDTRATSTLSALSTFDLPTEPSTPASASTSASAAAEEKPTSDWFAPRKPAPAKGPQSGGSTNGSGISGVSGIQGANGVSAAGAGANGAGGARPGASGTPGASGARPGGGTGGAGPLGARPGGTNGAGLPGATGAGPVAPGHGGGTGSFDVSDAVAASTASFPAIGTDDDGERRRDDLPYFSEGGARGPSGPTGGPVTGDGPVIPPAAPNPGGPGLSAPGTGHGGPGLLAPGAPGAPGAGPGGPFDRSAPGTPGIGHGEPFDRSAPRTPGIGHGEPFDRSAPGTPGAGPGSSFDRGAPGTPGTGPFDPGAPGTHGAAAGQGLPGGGLSDDTAILTPQKPAPEPGLQGRGVRHDNVSGHTVTSGIPVVPPGDRSGPFGAGSHPEGPVPHTPPDLPDAPAQQNATDAKPAKAAAPAKKKGRSKLVLLGGGVILVAGVAYGAGLLMNHSDVPKGTTVLGVDIGGGTRDEAVEKLDTALGSRTDKPLPLSIDGKTVPLKPDQAGLQFDSKATVAAAATSDYNPVSVIGSLFGQHRVVQPVMPVDEEKLQAALQRLAGGSGSMVEGTIKFESGRAVAVYGKAGKGIDVGASIDAVEQAYRTEVETGSTTPVKVATTTRQPTVSNAEVDREMKAFAEPAMSAAVTVRTDAAHTVLMSPQKSLWKFLRVTAVNGKLVDKPDLAALKTLYGQTFDGVLIARANGKKTPVTPEEVYLALRQALMSKTDRVAVINTNPS